MFQSAAKTSRTTPNETLTTEQYEKYEEVIAAYCFTHICAGVNKYFELGKAKPLSDCIKDFWKGEIRNNGNVEDIFFLPSELSKNVVLPNELKQLGIGLKINLVHSSEGPHGAGLSVGRIKLKLESDYLEDADSINDPRITKMLARLQYQLYHETTHLKTGIVGRDAKTEWYNLPKSSSEYRHGQLLYYTDPGEVKAHARQYAIIFMNKFPGQEYSPDLFTTLAKSLGDIKMIRYAAKLNSPNVHAYYPEFAERLTAAHADFQNYMKRFIKPEGYQKWRLS